MGSVEEEEELEMDEESGRQMEMHTLNQLNSLLKPDRRAPKRPMPCGLGHSPHVDNGGMDGIEFNMRLISEVRGRAYLYDVMAEAYNNPAWRVSAWNEVAMRLECTADQVKTRWKTLRDKFKKEDKKVRSGESSNWMYYEAMEFLQPHLRDKNIMMQQHHEVYGGGRSQSDVSTKWRQDDRFVMKEMEDGPSVDKKPRMDEENVAGVQQQQQQQSGGSIMVDTDESSTTGADERDERAGTSASGEYHRDMLLRMGNRHYVPHHSSHSPSATVRLNMQNEDEVFGHLIALRLAKMDPRFKEAVKVKLMQTLYEEQYGLDSPQTTVAQQ
ncbi:hypothetical protein PENTCL1PPCAC_18589 [Pristionchus entomophagus]|uniref:MADF domain-containing protein n=1 Tax=Pristionchus entomophagus TaxID=358040 RepID=A0AAV5TQX7_9BILA|nr:hypothetical protein PENTCL1PPCAC_18589 [Pristionchus entomophagus]